MKTIKVKNSGLPTCDTQGRRGDLIIHFEVKFPNVVSDKSKVLIESLDCI